MLENMNAHMTIDIHVDSPANLKLLGFSVAPDKYHPLEITSPSHCFFTEVYVELVTVDERAFSYRITPKESWSTMEIDTLTRFFRGRE